MEDLGKYYSKQEGVSYSTKHLENRILTGNIWKKCDLIAYYTPKSELRPFKLYNYAHTNTSMHGQKIRLIYQSNDCIYVGFFADYSIDYKKYGFNLLMFDEYKWFGYNPERLVIFNKGVITFR